jgi:hypothetical protein
MEAIEMGNVKINKLLPTLEKNRGTQKSFVISTKDLSITIHGEIHRIDDQYCFTRGIGKVVIEQEKSGTLLSWKGTYKTYSVRFMVGETILAEFQIPKNAKLSLDESG